MAKYKAPQNTGSATPAARSNPAPLSTGPSAGRSEFKGSGTTKPPVAAKIISHDQIARRAYEIYAGRGYAAGDQTADWHEAERQLKAGL